MHTFREYQTRTADTAIYPGINTALGLVYCALKLNGEAGEVAENVGKALRDDQLFKDYGRDNREPIVGVRQLTVERRAKLIKELGDVLWYVSQMCTELNVSLEDVALANIIKLADRKARGVLQGSGDER